MMIMLCERCCGPIGDGEPVVRLAHIDHAHPDGSVSWVHSFLHTPPCAEPSRPAHQRPDSGAWNPARGIGSQRR